MRRSFSKLIYRMEVIVKKAIFNCQGCGQCLLVQTGLICPMNCPKRLRNGPCGGTIDGYCEVYKKKKCIWLRIHQRKALLEKLTSKYISFPAESPCASTFHLPVNTELFHTSSLQNFFYKRDLPNRTAIRPHATIEEQPRYAENEFVYSHADENRLREKFRNLQKIITAEIRSPVTEEGMPRVIDEIRQLAPLVDALNVTSNHGGIKRLDTLVIAKEIRKQQCEVILQVCGRDVSSESFTEYLSTLYDAGYYNLLCLTGDWSYRKEPGKPLSADSIFGMDSSQMIHAAERARQQDKTRLLIGAAINPQTSPQDAVIRRLQQKVVCGAEFFQTQVIVDADSYLNWLAVVKSRYPQLAIIVGIPFIGSLGGLNALAGLPGVKLPDNVYKRIKNASNTSKAGSDFARQLIDQLLTTDLVDGFHLMNFGISAQQMTDEINHLRVITKQAPAPELIISNPEPTQAKRGFKNRRKEMQQITYATPAAKTLLKGKSSELSITPGSRTYTIGERCNVLGYQSVKQAVEKGDLELIVRRAQEQEKAGADIINISMIGSTVPEIEILPEVVRLVSNAVSSPLSIDFGSIDALSAALEYAPDRSLINSVSGETSKCEPVLELARSFNAALIAMPCSNQGIPATARERLDNAIRLIKKAESYGISRDDLIFDAICLAVATDQNAGITTFETCQLFRDQLGVNIVLGASNVSFGLPNRSILNSTYLSMAIASGMNVALTDITLPAIKWAIRSADCCLGHDQFATRYIKEFRRESAGACA